MSYYSNEFENTKDYLEGKTPLIKELSEVRGVPEGADLQTHLRMMYGHVAWNNLIIELTPEIISLLKTKIDSVETGFNVLQTLQPHKHVALLNTETLGPITYNEIITDSVSCWMQTQRWNWQPTGLWKICWKRISILPSSHNISLLLTGWPCLKIVVLTRSSSRRRG